MGGIIVLVRLGGSKSASLKLYFLLVAARELNVHPRGPRNSRHIDSST